MATVEVANEAARFDAAYPIEGIRPNGWNPRKIRRDGTKFRELVESIRARGILQPILTRRVGDIEQIIEGECRYTAALEVGLSTMPILSRDVDEHEAKEMTVVANTDRDDLTPLEEADGYALLVDDDWTIERVAERMRVSVRTVARRLSLRNLTVNWRTALAGRLILRHVQGDHGEDVAIELTHWGPSHMEQIARLPQAVQERILDQINHAPWRAGRLEKLDVTELHEWLEPYTRLLSNAPFDVDDAQLHPAAGSCLACPKQTGAQAELFEPDRESTCLDSACWDIKVNALVQKRIDELEGAGAKVWITSTSEYERANHWREDKRWRDRYKLSPLQKKEAKGLTAVVVATGAKAGQVKYAMTREAWDKKQAKKNGGDSATGNGSSGGSQPTPGDRYDDKLDDIARQIISGEHVLPEGEGMLEELLRETFAINIASMRDDLGIDDLAGLQNMGRDFPGLYDQAKERLAGLAVTELVHGALRAALWSMSETGDFPGQLPESAWVRFGVDTDALKRECDVDLEALHCSKCKSRWSATEERGGKPVCPECIAKSEAGKAKKAAKKKKAKKD